jgi:Tfp pilus assembly protein PilO
MAKPQISTRRLAISKANAQMVAIVGAAAFITVFCLVASKAVFSQNRYQAHVVSAKEKAHHQLEANLETYNKLAVAYKAFDEAPTNVIGGTKDGTGPNDGSNSKIILDSLPSTYDFPALTSSVEKILTDNGLKVTEITGTDDQINQQKNTSSPNPKPVSMPFSFTITNASYSSVSQLIAKLQQSSRPIQIDSLELSGAVNDMTVTVNAHTYFQPAKNVTISKKVIK